MKAHRILFILALFLILSGSTSAFSAAALPDDPGWPRLIKKNGKELTIYQPQVDFWQDYQTLRLRFAISVKAGKTMKEKFGVAAVDADTVTDLTARVVAVTPKNRELRFPNASDAEAASLQNIVDELLPPRQVLAVSLHRILAYIDPAQQLLQYAVELNLDPPKIFYSRKPAILVMFMGEPQLEPVKNNKKTLMFAANTNWNIFYDTPEQRYYLLNQNSWLTTKDLTKGPWTPTTTLPTGLSFLPTDDKWADVRSRIPGKLVKRPPIVFVSEEPAELILTKGEPTYSPIPGTNLLRLTNTESAVFRNPDDGNYYFLTAGRWFRATSLDGPWSIAGEDLPSDFAMIPEDDPAAFVKAAVPGTIEAKDAVLLASVPKTTTMDINNPPKVQVTYNGEPDFQDIPSTMVKFAANSPNAVFLVDDSYYCCDRGVWYSSTTANGPWMYCTEVPAEIYTIPPSHPMHNVTYVVVQSSTPATVVYAQTAGYSGEYVAASGVLMFGAGMIMDAMTADQNNNYYPLYPVQSSYGYAARYNYASGGFYRAAQASYGPYRGAVAGTAYNPNSEIYSRGATANGLEGSTSVRQAYNPNTGKVVRGGYRSNNYGSAAAIQTNKGTGPVAWDAKNGQGAIAKGKQGNVYAGKDGNVYKKDSSGNWSSNAGGGWAPVVTSQRRSDLESQAQVRRHGNRISRGSSR